MGGRTVRNNKQVQTSSLKVLEMKLLLGYIAHLQHYQQRDFKMLYKSYSIKYYSTSERQYHYPHFTKKKLRHDEVKQLEELKIKLRPLIQISVLYL